jgi:ubiquinone/menaquinone biosynthesis C-methylase UbiE
LLSDLAIFVSNIDSAKVPETDEEHIRLGNRAFYDEIGWESDGNDFVDAKLYEDVRSVSSEYRRNCHKRINEHIAYGGKYLVDVASGPIQYPEYVEYSNNYEYRICVDFSLSALKQAKSKLGDKGIYVLGDITNMPFKDNSVDAAISLHTIYHVPKEEQVKAMNEVNRIIKPEKTGVIVYSWGQNSKLMNWFFFPKKVARYFKIFAIRTLNLWKNTHIKEHTSRGLYFYSIHHKKLLPQLNFKYEIKSWRSVSSPFLRLYIHKFLFGKQLLKYLFRLENKYSNKMGLIGQYPLFILRKD